MKLVLAGVVMAFGLLAATAYAVLPTTSVPASSVPLGTLAGGTPIDVDSVSAFTRAIRQDHGTNVVITRNHFNDGQSTGWHTHPGPNIVVIVSGGFKLLDEKCNESDYAAGTGFATGLGVHEAIAVGATEFYSIYFLPETADVLRTPPTATDTTLNPRCAS